ncbi:hypothetical protein JW935_28145 [candidate division KSB1 bacterium]|nr:hypothetical protein [candidate division KSB1 bacterium]
MKKSEEKTKHFKNIYIEKYGDLDTKKSFSGYALNNISRELLTEGFRIFLKDVWAQFQQKAEQYKYTNNVYDQFLTNGHEIIDQVAKILNLYVSALMRYIIDTFSLDITEIIKKTSNYSNTPPNSDEINNTVQFENVLKNLKIISNQIENIGSKKLHENFSKQLKKLETFEKSYLNYGSQIDQIQKELLETNQKAKYILKALDTNDNNDKLKDLKINISNFHNTLDKLLKRIDKRNLVLSTGVTKIQKDISNIEIKSSDFFENIHKDYDTYFNTLNTKFEQLGEFIQQIQSTENKPKELKQIQNFLAEIKKNIDTIPEKALKNLPSTDIETVIPKIEKIVGDRIEKFLFKNKKIIFDELQGKLNSIPDLVLNTLKMQSAQQKHNRNAESSFQKNIESKDDTYNDQQKGKQVDNEADKNAVTGILDQLEKIPQSDLDNKLIINFHNSIISLRKFIESGVSPKTIISVEFPQKFENLVSPILRVIGTNNSKVLDQFLSDLVKVEKVEVIHPELHTLYDKRFNDFTASVPPDKEFMYIKKVIYPGLLIFNSVVLKALVEVE